MLVSPSILNADYMNLEKDIKRIDKAGADRLHIDIMDGRFVRNITWGPPTVSAIKKITNLPIDIHLMVSEPERFIDDYIELDVNCVLIHPESTYFLRKVLLEIKDKGILAGVALKLETSVDQIMYALELVDEVLLLSSDEGFGGGEFQSLVLKKVSYLKRLRRSENLNFKNQIDGGINLKTAERAKKMGIDIIVSGSYVIKNEVAIKKLKQL